MTEKLLPCPFCGGEASLALTNREDERSGYRATFSAYCKTCSGMTARTSTTDKNGWNNEGDESIKRRVTEAWNRRTPAPEGVVVAWRFRTADRTFGQPGPWLYGGEPIEGATPGYYEVQPLYASPVVPVGREEITAILAAAFEDHQRGAAAPGDALFDFMTKRILAALGTKATDTGRER